ncbi:MAG: FkbM family methyltransferase [Acetobacteraceae bacterium]
MAYEQIKSLAITAGVYRHMRLAQRTLRRAYRRRHQGNLTLYSQFLQRGDLAIDVGANIGEKTEALLILGAKVISLEPQPALVREIKARCGHFGDKLRVIQAAVGDHEGTAELHLRQSSGIASLLEDWEGTPTGVIDVPLTTLDRIIAKHGIPRLCKVDVEGAELQVLRGLSHRIPLMTLEYHTDERCAALARECIARLSELGTIEINATGEEEASMIFPRWLSAAVFMEAFPGITHPHYYGDLLVRAL